MFVFRVDCCCCWHEREHHTAWVERLWHEEELEQEEEAEEDCIEPVDPGGADEVEEAADYQQH